MDETHGEELHGGHPPATVKPKHAPMSTPEDHQPTDTHITPKSEIARSFSFASDTRGAVTNMVDQITRKNFASPERRSEKKNIFAWLGGAVTGILSRDTGSFLTQQALPPFIGAAVGVALTPAFHAASRILGKDTYYRLATRMMKRGNGGFVDRILHGGEYKDAKNSLFRENDTTRDMMKMIDAEGNIDQEALKNLSYGQEEVKKMILWGTFKASQLKTAALSQAQFSEPEIQQLKRIESTSKIAQWLLDNKFTAEERLNFNMNEFTQGLDKIERAEWSRLVAKSTVRNAVKSFFTVGLAGLALSDTAATLFGQAKATVTSFIGNGPGWISSAAQTVNTALSSGSSDINTWAHSLDIPGSLKNVGDSIGKLINSTASVGNVVEPNIITKFAAATPGIPGGGR